MQLEMKVLKGDVSLAVGDESLEGRDESLIGRGESDDEDIELEEGVGSLNSYYYYLLHVPDIRAHVIVVFPHN